MEPHPLQFLGCGLVVHVEYSQAVGIKPHAQNKNDG